ncbi:MAG: (2Fe-2S)-binding protein [Alphaproteobacteria bacterium]
MYRRLPSADGGARLRLTIDGVAVEVRPGETVAAALFLAGHKAGRTTPVSGAERGPYCMMGVCFDCLVEIDGEGNRQACMIEARDGMAVTRQMGARVLGAKVGA